MNVVADMGRRDDPQQRTRRQLIGWVVLGLAVAVCAILISAASTTTRESRRAVGNGVGRYVDVTTSTDTMISAVAWLVLAAGTGAWVWLVRASVEPAQPSTARRRIPALVGSAVVVLTGYLWVAAPLLAGDGFEDSERYESVHAVVRALGSSGMPCAEVAEAPANGTTALFAAARVCRQPNPADIRDGHDEVVVAIFAGGSPRNEWTDRVGNDDVYAVIGPRWIARCEFQATCARIQASIGGRNY